MKTDPRTSVEDLGFETIHGMLAASEVHRVADAISRSALPRTKAGIRHALREPAIFELANDPRLVDLAKNVLGEGAIPYRATLFDKSPASNWLVVWHQDTSLPLQQQREVAGWGPWSVKDGVTYAHAPATALEQVLAIRVHLDDSNSENGPLRVLPGTQNQGLLTDDEIHALSGQIQPVECTVSRGGLVLMRPLLVHASSKSKSEMSRRVIHIEYAAERFFDGLELRQT